MGAKRLPLEIRQSDGWSGTLGIFAVSMFKRKGRVSSTQLEAAPVSLESRTP